MKMKEKYLYFFWTKIGKTQIWNNIWWCSKLNDWLYTLQWTLIYWNICYIAIKMMFSKMIFQNMLLKAKSQTQTTLSSLIRLCYNNKYQKLRVLKDSVLNEVTSAVSSAMIHGNGWLGASTGWPCQLKLRPQGSRPNFRASTQLPQWAVWSG